MKKNEQEAQIVEKEPIAMPLETVLPQAMLPYAEFVIMDRALPRVEDGLKPVQRRILYTMSEMGLTPDKPHKKSARIVGDCMGKYHPHGDSSVYDAMVRMAQDFNMGMTLVNGHGNFGSVDGDSAAAMRYTEARMQPLALELLRDLEKDTVSFSLNFDDSLKEPDMLPGRFPNLLVNGASGIAVGLATNIPPHNLSEAIDGVIAYVDNPRISLDEMMKYIPAPDFPTGGYILENELKQAYKTGKGRITLRAKMKVEKEGEKRQIIITELPYQVNKANLLRRIAELREEKKELFAPISRVVDESDRNGMRAVIEVKGDFDLDPFLNLLYKHTDLEISFGINMVAIAGGKPLLMGLVEIIRYYVNYQREVILRRSRFELNQAKERCHVLEGLIVAVRNIDEVIAIIKKADSVADAREKLRTRFDLSERQAQAILDLRLARLTKLEVFKLEEELANLKKEIERLTAIVGSNRLQLNEVKKELREIQKKYAIPRRSQFVREEKDARPERLDVTPEASPSVFCIMADGTLKCILRDSYKKADKKVGEKTKPSSIVKQALRVVSDTPVLIFTSKGNCFKVLPQEFGATFHGKGKKLTDVCEGAEKGELPVALFAETDESKKDLLFITSKGMVKKTARSEYIVQKRTFQAIRLNDGDSLISVQTDVDDEEITLSFVTRKGMWLKAKKDDIPQQGRTAGGVRGMDIGKDDEVIFGAQTGDEGELVVVVSSGRYKRLVIALRNPTARNCKGVKITALQKEEEILFTDFVTERYFLAIADEEGTLRTIETEEIAVDKTETRGQQIKSLGTPKAVYSLRIQNEEE